MDSKNIKLRGVSLAAAVLSLVKGSYAIGYGRIEGVRPEININFPPEKEVEIEKIRTDYKNGILHVNVREYNEKFSMLIRDIRGVHKIRKSNAKSETYHKDTDIVLLEDGTK